MFRICFHSRMLQHKKTRLKYLNILKARGQKSFFKNCIRIFYIKFSVSFFVYCATCRREKTQICEGGCYICIFLSFPDQQHTIIHTYCNKISTAKISAPNEKKVLLRRAKSEKLLKMFKHRRFLLWALWEIGNFTKR